MEIIENHNYFRPSLYNWCFAYSDKYDIWFNGFTEAAVLADSQTSANIRKVLNRERLSEGSDPLIIHQRHTFINWMKRAGFIIDKEFDELEVLKIRHLNARIGRDYGVGLSIAPTMGCNLSCPYCYAFRDPDSKMSSSICDAVVCFAERLIQYNKAEKFSVSWVGGEPLFAFDVLYNLTNQLYDMCLENNCTYSHYLTTNGVLLNEEMIQKLTEGLAPIKRVQITLDGPRNIHNTKRVDKDGNGTYDRIIENICRLRGKCNVDIRINVDNKMSVEQVVELLNELKSLELIGFYAKKRISYYIAPITTTTEKCQSQSNVCFSRPEFSKFAKQLYEISGFKARFVGFPNAKPVFCGLLSRTSYAIDSKGRISKCWETMGNSNRCIGHVAKPLSLSSKILREWLLHDPLNDNSDCHSCKYLPICMGGCPEVVMTQGRSLEVCDHIKWDLKERLIDATDTYLALTKHKLGNTQLYNELVRREFSKDKASV